MGFYSPAELGVPCGLSPHGAIHAGFSHMSPDSIKEELGRHAKL